MAQKHTLDIKEYLADKTIDLSSSDIVCPSAMVECNGQLVIADQFGHKLVFTDLNGKLIRTIGEKGNGLDQFHYPTSISLADNGDLLVADRWNHRVKQLSADGKTNLVFGTYGDTEGSFSEPWCARYNDGRIYVSDRNNHRIQVFDKNGIFINAFGIAGAGKQYYESAEFKKGFVYEIWNRDSSRYKPIETSFFKDDYMIGTLEYPLNFCISQSGDIYVIDSSDSCIQRFSKEGNLICSFSNDVLATGTDLLSDVSVLPEGIIILATESSGECVGFDNDGCVVFRLKSPNGRLNYLSLAGDGGVWAIDSWSKRLHKFVLR